MIDLEAVQQTTCGNPRSRLTNRLEKPDHVLMNDYKYLVSPLESTLEPISGEALREIATLAMEAGVARGINLIVCLESMGIPVGTLISQTANVPLCVARKKCLPTFPRVQFEAQNNYGSSAFYVYGDVTDKRILLVDDVVASGRTLRQATIALRGAGAIVNNAFVLLLKGRDLPEAIADLGIQLTYLACGVASETA